MKMLMKILCVGGALCVLAAVAPPVRAADPVAVEIHYQSGVKFFKRGLYDRAIREFEKTLEMEPQHGEARAYLEKVRALQETHRPAEARASRNAEIEKLYEEGRRLYRAKEYGEAAEVFNKVLALKPIDDFASYYRERCETFISKKLAREKKLEERRRRLEEKKAFQEAARRKKATPPPAAKKPEEAAVEKPAPADVPKAATTRERARREKLSRNDLRRKEKTRVQEERRTEVQRRREAKLREKEERYQEKLRLKEEKHAEAEKRCGVSRLSKEEKRQEKLARRESRLKAKEEKVAAAQARQEEARARTEAKNTGCKELIEARRRNKERFLEGVRAYGRKEYQEAIAAFRDVVKSEQETGALYTRSAARLMDKARKRQNGIGRDAAI